MNPTNYISMISRRFAVLSAASACLLLGSCASRADSSATPPPPGGAIIDAKPDPDHRKQIDGIQLVSINGRSVNGTRSVIQPGLNVIKTRFRWPQGLVQEVDLRFYATPDTVYFVYYDVFPPRTESGDGVAGKMVNSISSSGDPYGVILGTIFLGPPAAVIGIGERIGHGATQQRQSATYIDLAVVAHHSSQGVVRQVRAYPDGRVDENPWAAWAQMKAP